MKKGFTSIELLIVLSIPVIIAIAVVMQWGVGYFLWNFLLIKCAGVTTAKVLTTFECWLLGTVLSLIFGGGARSSTK